jgi:hypothetical protein
MSNLNYTNGPVMMHPSSLNSQSMQQPIPLQPQPPIPPMPLEIICIIVSKYSRSCTDIFEMIKFLVPHMNIRILEIDNPQVRRIVVESGHITTVPAVALIYPHENKKEFYEGPQAVLILQKAVEKVKQKIMMIQQQTQQQTQQQSSKRSSLQDILDDDENDMTATLDSRTQPPSMPIGQGHEELSASSIPTHSRKATEPLSQRDSVDTSQSGFNFPVIDDSIVETNKPEGMNMDDILGQNAGIANRERDRKSHSIKSNSEAAIAEREAFDAQLASRHKPSF